MKQIRRRLTYANVMSTIAVFFVLGGATAVAAKQISGKRLKAGSVTAAKIKRGAVTARKVRKAAIRTAKLADGAVTNEKLGAASVTADKIAPGFVAPAAEKLSRAANISFDGTVLAGSAGIAQTNVTHPSQGFYCFSGLSPAPAGGVATIDYSEAGENILIQFDTGQGPVCPEGTQAFVNPRATIGDEETEPVDAGFFLILY